MRRKILWLILRIGVSVGIVSYIFSKPDISFQRIVSAIKHINLSWLVTALLVYKVVLLISSYRWRILVRAQGISISYAHAVGLTYIGCFFNNFMLGLTGGDVVKAYYATRLTTDKKTEMATIVFVDRLVGIAGLSILGLIGCLFGIGDPKMRPALIVILCVVLFFTLLSVLAFNKTLAGKFGRYVAHPKIKEVLKRVYEAVYFYKGRKRVLLEALGFSVMVWIGLSFVNLLLAKGLGAEVSPRCYFALIPVIRLISSIPITVAGWGLREQMYKQFFGTLGMDSGLAVSLSVTFALTMVLSSLVGGVLYAARLPRFRPQPEGGGCGMGDGGSRRLQPARDGGQR